MKEPPSWWEPEDRKNYIIRHSNASKQSHLLAANLDQCMLIVTINYPEALNYIH